MKKLLFILMAAVAILFANESKAQGPFALKYGQNAHLDTLVDNGNSYFYVNTANTEKASGIDGAYEDLGIEWNAKKLTGTTIGGYAILQSCNDTLLWTNHYGTSADSFTVTNVTTDQTKKWTVGAIDYKYYRVKWVPSQSTQTIKVKSKASIRSKK